jgi:hypothetical protein
LIYNFHKLNRITNLLLIIFIFCAAFYNGTGDGLPAYAQTVAKNSTLTKDQLFSKQLVYFLKSLKKAPRDKCIKIFGRYEGIIAKEISLDKLYFVTYKDVEKLLNQAVCESIDSLTLFTHPLLQDQTRFAIIFNKELLAKIHKNFDFHALFNISMPSTDGGPNVKMKFLILGQDKIIVSYNRNATIKHPDYDFATGNYDYKKLFVMDVKKDSRGNRGIFNIKGRANPHEKSHWMRGPLNASIHSLIMSPDQASRPQILIEYELFYKKHKLIKPIPIEKFYKD